MKTLLPKEQSNLRMDFGAGMLLQMVQVGASFVTTVLLARLLEPEGYGIYSYTISFLTLLSVPALSGLPVLAVREIAQAQARQAWGKLKGILIWISLVSIGMIILMGLIGVFIRAAGNTRLASLDQATTFWALIMLPFWVWGRLGGAVLRGLNKIKSGILCQEVLRPALLALFILTCSMIEIRLLPQNAMALHALAALITFIIAVVVLIRVLPQEVRTASPEFANRAWGMSILPLALLGGMLMINLNASMVILGVLASPEDVGIFRVAVQVTTLMEIGLYVANLTLAPKYSTLFAQGQLREMQSLATRSARIVFLFSLLVVAFLIIFGRYILELVFGPSYVQAYLPIIPLILAQLVSVFFGSVVNILNMSGNERYTALGITIAAIVNILVSLLLIPALGAFGAGVASAVSMVVWNIVLWRFLQLRLGIDSTILARG